MIKGYENGVSVFYQHSYAVVNLILSIKAFETMIECLLKIATCEGER